MKKLFTILFLLVSILTYSQNQSIEFCDNERLSFNYFAIGTANCKYTWNVYFNDKLYKTSYTDSIIVNFPKIGSYRIVSKIENDYCESEEQIYVVDVFPCREPILLIPNAFTPNGDQLNDNLKVEASYVEKFNFYIYNSWGGEIFSASNFSEFWDGTFQSVACPTGVYFYLIEFWDIRGKRNLKKGSITLYR